MAGMIKAVSMVLIATVLIAAALPRGQAKITCNNVVSHLTPCLPYVTDKGPIGKCCDGIKNLNASAKAKDDRQAVCGCLKSMATTYKKINFDKIAGLPKECGVDIPYVISPKIDCSKVK